MIERLNADLNKNQPLFEFVIAYFKMLALNNCKYLFYLLTCKNLHTTNK